MRDGMSARWREYAAEKDADDRRDIREGGSIKETFVEVKRAFGPSRRDAGRA